MTGLPWVDLALAALAAIGTLGAAIAWLRAREERQAGATQASLTRHQEETERGKDRGKDDSAVRDLTREQLGDELFGPGRNRDR